MKSFLLIAFLIISGNLFSQHLIEPNEDCIYSFKTKNGKTMMLAKDKNDQYIIYRFGTNAHIDFEFPQTKDSTSWSQFSYNYYFRGGGYQNAGLDIDNLIFENKGYQYIVFSSYSAGEKKNDEHFSIGIIITDKKSENKTIIKGRNNTEVGNLQGFRTNEMIKINQEGGLEDDSGSM